MISEPWEWKGDSGLSRRVAEISASMIWPGVISMGMPRSGEAGLTGAGREGETMLVSVESDTGEVGRDTVTGTLVFTLRLKQATLLGHKLKQLLVLVKSYLLVLMVLVKVLVTGLTATIRRPSAVETTTSL